MRKRKLLFSLLALGLGAFLGGSGAMAQSGGWDAVYAQTQTTSDDWTPITESTTQGKILGAAQSGSNATYYYYVTKNLNFTNNRTDNDGNGNSGLKIHGTVYLYVPAGLTITCEGANADGRTGAGAGIELASGNTLYIIGGGTVNAYGGDAANGRNGDDGTNAGFNEQSDIVWPGDGGKGGNGGGGAGAGIGSRGGTGGTGGAGGDGPVYPESSKHDGIAGSAGGTGGTATAMGNLYVANGTTVNATGGSQASTGGTGGNGGSNILRDGGSNDSMAGGAGGGGGGFGGAASNIGTGGCGGGGGGGGAGGSVASSYSTVYSAGANGGHPGVNGDGTFTTFGASTLMAAGTVKDHEGDDMTCVGWEDNHDNRGAGGGSGDRGYAASKGTQNEGTKTYKITFRSIKTDLSNYVGEDKPLKHDTSNDTYYLTYSPGTPNIVLPKNEEGYNWVLRVYGKSCTPNGTSDSEFATPTKAYYGGNYTEESYRTILLNHVYGDLVFQEVASMCTLNCSTNNDESTDNSQDLIEFNALSYDITVRLQDRTLYKDNHYNTICLPFAMTKTQIANSPLAGATIMRMNESVSGYYADGNVEKSPTYTHNYGHPVVLFWFNNVDVNGSGTVLEAGKPYLVKWAETSNGNIVDNTSDDNTRHELDFEGVTISATTPGSWTGSGTTNGSITFQGTFSLSDDLNKLDADGNMNLVLGAGDKLYHPSSTEVINVAACRGYFKIPAAAVSSGSAPQFVMGFDDGETTDIRVLNVTPESLNNGAIYNLSGQRLNSLQKGINIVNGKKVVVK